MVNSKNLLIPPARVAMLNPWLPTVSSPSGRLLIDRFDPEFRHAMSDTEAISKCKMTAADQKCPEPQCVNL
jgi:hypothetical protein